MVYYLVIIIIIIILNFITFNPSVRPYRASSDEIHIQGNHRTFTNIIEPPGYAAQVTVPYINYTMGSHVATT